MKCEQSLKGKLAVISGASRGLGKALAEHFVALGARVVLIARDRARLDAVAAPLGDSAFTIACDLSQSAQVARAAEAIAGKVQAVDILINNAGIPAPRTLDETNIADWDEVIGVNLSGAFYLTRALWPLLLASQGGYVINISGVAGRRGGAGPAYASSKYGLTGLTQAIAFSGKKARIRATVLYLGAMDTGWRGQPIGERSPSEAMDPREVARFVAHLVTSPQEFVVNEAVINPIAHPWL